MESKFICRIILLSCFVLSGWTSLLSSSLLSSDRSITGIVTDAKTKEVIAFSAIYAHEISRGTASDNDGFFKISTAYTGNLKISVSSVGYQTLDTIITLPITQLVEIRLRPANYSLKEVVVVSKEGTMGNSTSLIEKAAMQHIQPSSFADILQLLPGHSSKEVDLSKSNYVSMRQAGSDNNTSLGTSFIVDGTNMSNNANLQAFYGLTEDAISTRTTTSKGVDLRSISTDKIESVEVIRGIPSAKYGDVTAGVVKIELKSGHTPWEGRVKVDLKNKLYSIGKGLDLSNNNGIINFDIDYAFYSPDARSNTTDYTRTTGAVRYENSLALTESTNLILKGNVSYTGSFDDVKTDKDILADKGYLKTSYNSINSSLRATLKSDKSFVKQATLQASFSYTKDELERYALVSGGGKTALTSIAMEEGIYDTHFLPTEWYSKLLIDGKPITLGLDLDLKSELKSGSALHSLNYGLSYSYDKNEGKGAIFDKELPPYSSSKSARARAFNSIPAMQRLSFYIEDNLNWKLGESTLLLQPGIRITTLPGIDSKYKMSGKFYAEPRVNTKYTFPKFNIGSHLSSLAITGGAGILYKFPTLYQLYPDKIYSDYIQLNYYPDENEDYRYANVKTYVTDPTNYELEPAKNLKFEAGFIFIVGQVKTDVTVFYEKMKNGFSTGNTPAFHNYRYYDPESNTNTTGKPGLDDFAIQKDFDVAALYQQNFNNASVYKSGIEYTINLGKIPAIYTSVWVNGAWFRTHYKNKGLRFYKPEIMINIKEEGDEKSIARPYPYIGVYDYNTDNKRSSQFNTNINFDTHIPMLRMIFTTSIQNMWYEWDKYDYNRSTPTEYIDAKGNWRVFTPEMADMNIFKDYLVDKHNAYYFLKRKTAMATRVNLKLSKEIGDNIRLACYFNNILSYLPDYTSYTGVKITNRSNGVSPYFGAELNIKF